MTAIQFRQEAVQMAFRDALQFVRDKVAIDLGVFFKDLSPHLIQLQTAILRKHHGIKIWLRVQVNYMHTINANRQEGNVTSRSQ